LVVADSSADDWQLRRGGGLDPEPEGSTHLRRLGAEAPGRGLAPADAPRF
jgi:hypothetical protein